MPSSLNANHEKIYVSSRSKIRVFILAFLFFSGKIILFAKGICGIYFYIIFQYYIE